MNKFAIAIAALSALLNTPAVAAPDDDAEQSVQRAYEQSANADDAACHGQGRAWHAEMLSKTRHVHGWYISQRQGDQHDINVAWVEYYCGDWPGAH